MRADECKPDWDAAGFHRHSQHPEGLLQNTDWKPGLPHSHANTIASNSRGHGMAVTEPFSEKVTVP